jgi:hypothetical protein
VGQGPVGEEAARLLVHKGRLHRPHQGELHLQGEKLQALLIGEEGQGLGLDDLVLQKLQDLFRQGLGHGEGLHGVLGPEGVGPAGVVGLGGVDVQIEG